MQYQPICLLVSQCLHANVPKSVSLGAVELANAAILGWLQNGVELFVSDKTRGQLRGFTIRHRHRLVAAGSRLDCLLVSDESTT